ncbi:MAG: hypothetical protein JWP89_2032 [Schlesneria sp.]|jgi:hypothetical protein|nr:hypothetical protein [Schlesneria sp.]
MHTFFHGWRRKAGVVTLLMACVLVAMWVRSFHQRDAVIARLSAPLYELESFCGGILVGRTAPSPVPIHLHWWSFPIYEGDKWDQDWFLQDFTVDRQSSGFRYRRGTLNVAGETHFWLLIVPYWSLILPLTLLSAYLILWKPRKRS